jgi:KEOPS complex subunit Cgi121
MDLVEGVATVESVDAFVDRLGAIGDERGVTVQAFDARYVVDRRHLERAVELTDRAIDRGENVAHDRAVEILCYAAGRRQIERALEMGVSAGEGPAVVLVDEGAETPAGGATDVPSEPTPAEREAAESVRSRQPLDPAATLGEYGPDLVRTFFDVGQAELAAADGDLPALVHERVALLDVEK